MTIIAGIHKLKTIQPFFDDIKWHGKTFELRQNDREFRVGDYLILKEYDYGCDEYGDVLYKKVSYIFHGGNYGLAAGYCIMGIVDISDEEKESIFINL